MELRSMRTIVALGLLAAFAAMAPDAAADPADSRLSSFADLSGLLEGGAPGRWTAASGWVAILQDDGWGWGEDEKPAEKKPPESRPDEAKPAESSGPAETPPAEEEEPRTRPGPGEEGESGEDEAARQNWAKSIRIGLEFGGFLPLGSMKEPYATGEFGGLVLGFGLPSVLGEFTPSSELRLVEGMTRSVDQEKGFDVSTTLAGLRHDFLFHLMPKSRSVNLFFFLGAGVMVEMSRGEGVDPETGESQSTSATYPFFLVDAGLGAWLNIAGPLDVFLRLEFDLIPVSQNVSTFALGELGLQVKF